MNASMVSSVRPLLVSAFLVLGLSACSGGGGSSSPSTATGSNPPSGSTPTWTENVFEPASAFKDLCENPRSGFDIEGNAFPDEPGSLLEENFWLRSWTHETYLWNDEVVDQDPANFTDRLDYFAVLKTTEVTPSGEDKDDFHFSEPTEEYLEQRNSAPSPEYGARLIAFSTTVPRDYRILYTEPNSPASTLVNGQANLERGTRILEIDGVDLVNASTQAEIDILNAGLFPDTVGETHTFLVQDAGSVSTRSISMSAANISAKPVNTTSIIPTSSGEVGYIHFTTFSPFSAEEEIATAITQLDQAGVNDLVLDLRYNGGGLLAIAAQLSYMVAGPGPTNGETFELLQFNEDAGNRNPVTGDFNEPIPFYSTGLGFSLVNGTPLDTLNLQRVFILSTESTCSASEAVINGLRGVDIEVILIGDTTCGKPYGFYPQDNCGETYYTIQFQGVNDKGFGDYADGFIPMNSTEAFGVVTPGCVVSDDLNNALGDPAEALLAAALQYREDNTCPALPASTVTSQTAFKGMADIATTTRSPMEDFLANNRDMTMPY